MGITGLLPFIEKASRRTNISEFNGCTVAIDSYCWLHKGAFACADRLVRGEETDIHIKYCLKYVNMLLSKKIKPILVFDGRHLPAKAMTESKRRESRDISKKRAAELLALGKMDEARSYMRRSVDITHEMALQLIKECRKLNVDCVVAPYEADAQLAYLNIKNIAHVVITEDSDLILFGCTKVFYKMDLEGTGTLVETAKLPLVMRCPIEHYSFDKFRQMCILSGCDYLASLPGIGLAKARQFVNATHDSNFANALKKLPSYFNRSSLVVTDEYRESFLKAEATFKYQYVYDPIQRKMLRLTDPENEDIEKALCVNAGELLDPKIAFQLALGNIDPFKLNKMDDWHPDSRLQQNGHIKSYSWKDKPAAHPSVWSEDYSRHLAEPRPWQQPVKPQPDTVQANTRPRKVVNLVAKYVPETQDVDESLSIQSLSNMYCVEPSTKRLKPDEAQTDTHKQNLCDDKHTHKTTSPILENKERSYRKSMRNNAFLKRLSKFPRTIIDDNVVESKFFSTSEDNVSKDSITIEESPEKSRNPFKVSKSPEDVEMTKNDDVVIIDCDLQENSQKENSPCNSPKKSSVGRPSSPMKRSSSPILSCSRNPFKRLDSTLDQSLSEDSVIDNTYPMETLITPVDSQESFGQSPPKPSFSQPLSRQFRTKELKTSCRVSGLKRTASLPTNQPTLLGKFGFQKKPVLKR